MYTYIYIYTYIPMGGDWLAGRSPGLCALLRIEGIRGTLWGAKPFRHLLPVGQGSFGSIEEGRSWI